MTSRLLRPIEPVEPRTEIFFILSQKLALLQSHVIICHCRPQRGEAISHNKLSLRGAQRRGNDNLLYKIAALRSQRRIATLPLVARNDKYTLKDNSLYHVSLEQCLKLIPKKI